MSLKLSINNDLPIIESGKQFIAEMNVIIDACDGFHANSKNENLKKNYYLLPVS